MPGFGLAALTVVGCARKRGLNRGLALLVAVAFFMEILDGRMIAPAAAHIAAGFGVGAVDINIAITAYVLTLAVVIPIRGRCARRSLGLRHREDEAEPGPGRTRRRARSRAGSCPRTVGTTASPSPVGQSRRRDVDVAELDKPPCLGSDAYSLVRDAPRHRLEDVDD